MEMRGLFRRNDGRYLAESSKVEKTSDDEIFRPQGSRGGKRVSHLIESKEEKKPRFISLDLSSLPRSLSGDDSILFSFETEPLESKSRSSRFQ